MKQRFLQKTVLAVFMLASTYAFAGGPPPPPPPPAPPSGVPIDGAAFLLLGLGLFYGAVKLSKESYQEDIKNTD